MRFNQAITKGNKVKRRHWGGYWELTKVNDKDYINIHCADGEVLEVRDTNDILFTLGNVCADDWVVIKEVTE